MNSSHVFSYTHIGIFSSGHAGLIIEIMGWAGWVERCTVAELQLLN